MKLYIMNVKEVEKNSILAARMFVSLDQGRQEKIENCRHDRDKTRSLCAGALLLLGIVEWDKTEGNVPLLQTEAAKVNWEVVQEYFKAEGKDASCTFGKNGKPYFIHYPQIHFNLSHSGDFVLAAFDSVPVGVDIQIHRKIKDSTARHFLHREELAEILTVTKEEEREELLCRLWAIKESYIKLTGEGMKKPMKDILVNRLKGLIEDRNGESVAGYKEKIWNGTYYISVCSF